MSNNNVTFSVCIASYNRAHYLAVLIESLATDMATLGERLQVVVSDNCSSDDTAARCRAWQDQGMNLKYMRNPRNIGPDRNYLAAVAGADGEYAMLIGDDDAVRPGLLAYLAVAMERHRPDVFTTDRVLCDRELNPIGMQKIGKAHTEPRLIDFAHHDEPLDYFSHVDSFIGTFSFLSTIGFRTAAWRATQLHPDAIGSRYLHVYQVMDMLVRQQGKLLYLPEPTILARMDNDRTLTEDLGSEFRRWHLDFDAFGKIAHAYYPHDAAMRRAFLNPVYQILNPGTRGTYLQMAQAAGQLDDAVAALNLLGLGHAL
ncbi:glycosyltransferase family 2 protein [Pelomonas sp. KK5]|uniref:glycosyltransferase family 2 protein n=1 Tax=Pelomonas sp. KK5 TaxID=1855730 RepID=UPI00097CAA8A|nr:glycosyltransferase family 2 protein [Pelomonas sp. KK5]